MLPTLRNMKQNQEARKRYGVSLNRSTGLRRGSNHEAHKAHETGLTIKSKRFCFIEVGNSRVGVVREADAVDAVG